METEHNDLPEWRPDELLEQAAARRGFTVEQFRARVRAVADEARKVSTHVSFEHARDLDLSDEEFVHAEHCRFCADLLRTIHPEEEVVRDFQERLARQLERRELALSLTTSSLSWSGTATIAAGIVAFFIAMGLSMWPRLSPPTVSIARDWRPVVDQSSANAAQYQQRGKTDIYTYLSPSSATVSIAGDLPLIHQSFAKAAQYQQRGKTSIANAFLVTGLATAGLKQPELQLVRSALSARTTDDFEAWLPNIKDLDLLRARDHFKVGNEVQGYKDVLTYLKSNEPASLATKAYRVDFIDRIAETSAVFQSSTGDKSPNINIRDSGDVSIQ